MIPQYELNFLHEQLKAPFEDPAPMFVLVQIVVLNPRVLTEEENQ